MDPAAPQPGDHSSTVDPVSGKSLANLGSPSANVTAIRLRDANAPTSAATTVDLDINKAQDFLVACMTSTPRVTYGLGAKVPFPNAVPGKDFQKIDCSGFVREAIRRAEATNIGFPDGSVVQHDWVRAHGFTTCDIASATAMDGLVRIAFLSPTDSPDNIGHVVLVYHGRTLESHGGTGPDSRPWTGAGWQAHASVYVLTKTT
jgi:hypothetical protein